LQLFKTGHAGHDTVDYVLKTLPSIIEAALIEAMEHTPDKFDPTLISNVLEEAIASFDDSMTQDLLRLFPTPENISTLSDGAIRAIINDADYGGVNSATVTRCMRGSTVLVSVLDPGAENLWVASLGDCQSGMWCCAILSPFNRLILTLVLAYKQPSGYWEALRLSSYHNGMNSAEKQRIIEEHPGEAECIVEDRVLGAIAVTRGKSVYTFTTPASLIFWRFGTAIGDHLFKLPSIYTDRIFMNKTPGFSISKKVGDFLGRNLTPPYVSNHADVRHVTVKALGATDFRLILCSDGLLDLYEEKELGLDDLAKYFAQTLGSAVDEMLQPSNLSLFLLRDALGGDDLEKVSRMVTVEMDFRWMDDTTILVQRL
jgi:pyruvate dehydrogenase phosphatase